MIANIYEHLWILKKRMQYKMEYWGGKETVNKNGKTIFLLLTPNYGNLGDQAIAYATIEYVRNEMPEYNIKTISLHNIYSSMKSLKKTVSKDDIILIQGGGNMGSLYPLVEYARQFIIKNITECKIISMPTSLFYDNDFFSNRLKKRSQKIYKSNKGLTLLLRDKKSYYRAKELYPNLKVLLFPDIVLYLHKIIKDYSKKDDVLICLRKDGEKQITNEERIRISEYVMDTFWNAHFIDTQVSGNISDDERDYEVTSIIRSFSKAKVVLTDRLHGMILSVITDTPCVVIDSLDGKVKETAKWFSNHRVKFIDDIQENKIIEVMQSFDDKKSDNKVWDEIDCYLDDLKGIMKE